MNEKTKKWFQDLSLEKLRGFQAGYPPHSDEYKLAELEIRQKEADAEKKKSDHTDKIEAVRFEETIALKKEAVTKEERRFQIQLDETKRQNWWTRAIAVAALVVSAASLCLSQCRKSANQGAANSQPVSQSKFLTETNSTATVKVAP